MKDVIEKNSLPFQARDGTFSIDTDPLVTQETEQIASE